MPRSEYSSASPLSLQGARALLGQRAQPGMMAGQGFWIGKYSIREKGEVGRGQKGEKEGERGSGTKQAGGYSRHPKPLNGALSPGMSRWRRGQALLPLEVARGPKVALELPCSQGNRERLPQNLPGAGCVY